MESFAQFSVSGQRLYGMLHVPEGERSAPGWPSVVLLHGFTGNRAGDHRLLPLFSRYLAARGVASLRFDFRGSGESQGDFSEMTALREVEDTEAACAYLRGLPMLDPERVMLLGFSMGGLVAALAAERVRPHRLALWAPALPELWLPLLRGGYAPPVILDYGGWPVGRAFLLEMPRLRPLEAAARWGGVARVFHGDADTVCPPVFGVRYAEALGCDAVAIPGANHTFDSLEAVELLYRETGRFLLGE
ncbi:alpha/beta superfamily hydrolase [Deinococcus geothermalis DSM 11300]|uniref:Alpha/beta superfamily hydrolase n=1 Tax=Deinococcus geothermalis (strain DSM 11300 / CIP 105573 / AG-3a) TaxID=319795 RepID=Q1J084_DEIGD|nr:MULTISPECIES: alpha/beta fold hydrolase [Deinococcus]ABF45100.1 alpha/beta superfamily hydrolase [Deinococcus geothermalis DSM 11300]MBI0444386.1 alpha/beta fold hydrolase [Deinococcus sp. DB0503]